MKQLIKVETKCNFCKETKTINLSKSGIERYKQGESIQKCFPFLSADDRELLISGTCGTCFDKMFGDDE